jgi:DNA repair exonuclease SbcCD nuclease subunit
VQNPYHYYDLSKQISKRKLSERVIRAKSKQPDAILTADWHLREDTPVCRTDDYWKEQWMKVQFIRDKQRKYDCPVIHAGDLFHHWKPSPYLLSTTIDNLPKHFRTVLGNHDLPQHSLELVEKCGVHTLYKAGALNILIGVHWTGFPNEQNYYQIENRKVLTWHTMTYTDKEPYPNCPDPPAIKLLKKYPEYDLIVTGDNHETFVEEYQGRLLVNPGSLMRMTAVQIEHRPCVFLWYAETNTVEPVYLPIEDGVISREHITKQEQRSDRIDAFISRLDGNWKAATSFEENLTRFEKANQIRESVMSIVHKAIET